MKRKASELDDGPSFGSWSPSSEFSSTFNGSPSRDAQWTRPLGQHAFINDHINVRTTKRTRDNRPGLDIIHQNTLAKLFDAQRQQHAPILAASASEYTHETMAPVYSIEPSQKSLHSFFNISHSQAPVGFLKTSGFQPSSDTPTACEDCGNALNPILKHNVRDTDMTDAGNMPSTILDEDYECAHCQRKVCDTCAVRGDNRVCLECAMPGGG